MTTFPAPTSPAVPPSLPTADRPTATRAANTPEARPALLFLNTRRTELEYAPAFAAAELLGFDVVLITDMAAPGLRSQLSAEVHTVGTYDADRVLALAQSIAATRPVAGVITWSDRDVVTMSRIAGALGLPGPAVAAAHRARNKAAMRRALAHRPDLIPEFRVVTGRRELEGAIGEIGFPAALKPTTGSGSKGIFLLENREQAELAWEFLR